MLVEQEPCSHCASGFATGAPPGIMRQFSEMYPELTIEVKNMRTFGRIVFKGGKELP
jgi:hypothetical protein